MESRPYKVKVDQMDVEIVNRLSHRWVQHHGEFVSPLRDVISTQFLQLVVYHRRMGHHLAYPRRQLVQYLDETFDGGICVVIADKPVSRAYGLGFEQCGFLEIEPAINQTY